MANNNLFFVNLSDVLFLGLVQIVDVKDDDKVGIADFPALGEVAQSVILGFKGTGMQIWLGTKRSQINTQHF